MKILGKRIQSNIFCDGNLYAAGGRPPLQWRNEHDTTCPQFGCFKIIGYDITENGAPIIRGTQPDGEDGSLYAFNLGSSVDANGSGCCKFDMALVASATGDIDGAQTILGPKSGDWDLDSAGSGYVSLGSSVEGRCLIYERPVAKVRDKTKLAQTSHFPYTPIYPNTIVGVYHVQFQCELDPSGEPIECEPCAVELMWAAHAWLGFEPIPPFSQLELTYMDDHEEFWDAVVPPDDPLDPFLPRNRGPWFIADYSCPNVSVPLAEVFCDDPETIIPDPSGSGVGSGFADPIVIGI